MTIAACPPSAPVTPGVVVFSSAEFLEIYPEFTGAATPALQFNFNLASLNISNCCGSPVPDPNVRQSLLYLLTAHITALFTPSPQNNGQPPGIVGRVSNASEGSVSVGAQFPGTPESAWFDQTKYGAQFWAITAVMRTMHHIPAPATCWDGLGFGEGFGFAEGNQNGFGC